jgi:hypothetical protein
MTYVAALTYPDGSDAGQLRFKSSADNQQEIEENDRSMLAYMKQHNSLNWELWRDGTKVGENKVAKP